MEIDFDNDKEIFRLGLRYCPNCFNNNLSNSEGNVVYAFYFKCLDCDNLFHRLDSLKLRDINLEKLIK